MSRPAGLGVGQAARAADAARRPAAAAGWLFQFALDGRVSEPEGLRGSMEDLQRLNVESLGGEVFVHAEPLADGR